ncbi:MAG: type II toxin-antitoxin system RelE/ParE family toxin [Dokdonella sp.]
MIRNVSDREAERIWSGMPSRRLPADIQRVARRKLGMLADASMMEDLRIPAANRLQAPKGSRKGQLSIRINDQWRICFRWIEGDAHDVEIVDYH